jgi:hypothetical protein
LSKGGLTQPSSEFFKQVQDFEKLFQVFHGVGISSTDNLIRDFSSFILRVYPNVHQKIAWKYARTRTFIRIKFLNQQLRTASNSFRKREAKKKSHFST